MREIVSWDDVSKSVIEYKKEHPSIYKVSVTNNDEIKVNGLNEEYSFGSKVSFTIDVLNLDKQIDKVVSNEVDIVQNEDNSFSFTMPNKEVRIEVTLKDKVIEIINVNEQYKIKEDETVTLNPKLNEGESEFIYEIKDTSIASVDLNGDVKGLKVGETKLIITSTINDQIKKEINIKVISKETSAYLTNYSITYDLGTRKTAKAIDNVEDAFKALSLKEEGEGIVNSISSISLLYGGGNGGSGDTSWYRGNMLKIGTTSVNGYIVFELKENVKGLKVTGYTYSQTGKIRVGDSSSSDFDGETLDNKTTLLLSSLTVAGKTTIENNEESTLEFTFTPASSVKLMVTNKKPLFITNIEFVIDEGN